MKDTSGMDKTNKIAQDLGKFTDEILQETLQETEIDLTNLGFIEDSILNILYPADATEYDIMELIIKIERLIEIHQLKAIKILNKEISVRLLLFLLDTIAAHKLTLYFPQEIYNQFNSKKETIMNMLKFDIDLIKVYNE